MKIISRPVFGKLYSKVRSGVSTVVYPQRQPQVNLGWQIKDSKDQLTEATLPIQWVKAIPKLAKACVVFMISMCPLSIVKSAYAESRALEKGIAGVSRNITKAKGQAMVKDSLARELEIPIPVRFKPFVQDIGSQAHRFYSSLVKNKPTLMKDLGIDGEKFDMYTSVAMKICKEESNLGTGTTYKLYDIVESSDFLREMMSKARRIKSGDGDLSLGMTRFKIAKASETEKELFKKYGITFDGNNSNILDPEKSAIATIIHLARLDADYPLYLDILESYKPNMSDSTVKQAIARAKEILFNDMLRPGAIAVLRYGEDIARQDVSLYIPKLSPKDYDALRTYASTVELSPQAYLAARWNGKKIIPEGAMSDVACANLLNIASQKGYISNIDKTSKVIY